MKEKIREFIFKLFQKQIMGICKPLLPDATFVRFKETKFDWIKISARVQANKIDSNLLAHLDRKQGIEREITRQLMVEISKKVEIEKYDTDYPQIEVFISTLYIANEPKY